jgi:hypothetical protein
MLGVELDGSRRVWLLTLDALSIPSDWDGSRRIVWMINGLPIGNRMTGQVAPALSVEVHPKHSVLLPGYVQS